MARRFAVPPIEPVAHIGFEHEHAELGVAALLLLVFVLVLFAFMLLLFLLLFGCRRLWVVCRSTSSLVCLFVCLHAAAARLERVSGLALRLTHRSSSHFLFACVSLHVCKQASMHARVQWSDRATEGGVSRDVWTRMRRCQCVLRWLAQAPRGRGCSSVSPAMRCARV